MKKKIEDRRNERREETREGRGAKMNRGGKTDILTHTEGKRRKREEVEWTQRKRGRL